MKAAHERLNTNPEDAEANFTVGRFYCLYKKDWPRGLPALARGSDAGLKALAVKELDPPKDVIGQTR